MTRTLWVALAVLCAWAFITIVRRISEGEHSEQFPDGKPDGGYRKTSMRNDIDWDELEKAEDEVKDIDPMAKPEDGFEGDDWGPGAGPKPPLA